MEISLPYGRGQVSLDIPDENLLELIRPRTYQGKTTIQELERALDEPLGEALEELAHGRRTCVLLEDDTRDVAHREVIDGIAERLSGATSVSFIICTGSHDPATEGNREIVEMAREAAERSELRLEGVHVNDCFASDFVEIGITKRGTPVRVNPRALGADLYVVGSDMKNHYFAGYSNALKNFLPGICAYDTVEANHSWALDPKSTFGAHPLHPDPSRRGNPLASDMLEARDMIAGNAEVFVLASISSHRQLLWSAAGKADRVTTEGLSMVDRLASFRVERTDHAIISPGGYPQDESLYHAQRGLELTKNAFEDGGRVLLLAECVKGIAPNEKAKENFYDRLTGPLDEVLDSIKSGYQLYSHKAYKFAEMISRLRSIEIYTELASGVLKNAHLAKAVDPQEVVDNWIKDDPGARILVFDDANKIAVYAG